MHMSVRMHGELTDQKSPQKQKISDLIFCVGVPWVTPDGLSAALRIR